MIVIISNKTDDLLFWKSLIWDTFTEKLPNYNTKTIDIYLQINHFFISSWSPRVPSIGKYHNDSYSSYSSSSDLITRNHTTSPHNPPPPTRWKTWDPYEGSSSCYADRPYPWQWQTRPLFAHRVGTASSYAIDRKENHFTGIQWWAYTYWLWYTYPYKGQYWDA